MSKETNIESQALSVATGATELVITNSSEMEQATEILSILNKKAAEVKKIKDEVMRPALDVVAAERKRWKPVEDLIKKATEHIRKQMSVYQTEQIRIAEAEKAKIAARVGEGKGSLKMTTAAKKMNEVVVPDQHVAAESGKVSFKTDYEVEVTDIHLIPAEFLEVKIPAIKAAHKAGNTPAGVTITEIRVPINRIN